MARAPLRLVRVSRVARAMLVRSCETAFGGGIAELELAERRTADNSVSASLRFGVATLLTLGGYFG